MKSFQKRMVGPAITGKVLIELKPSLRSNFRGAKNSLCLLFNVYSTNEIISENNWHIKLESLMDVSLP